MTADAEALEAAARAPKRVRIANYLARLNRHACTLAGVVCAGCFIIGDEAEFHRVAYIPVFTTGAAVVLTFGLAGLAHFYAGWKARSHRGRG